MVSHFPLGALRWKGTYKVTDGHGPAHMRQVYKSNCTLEQAEDWIKRHQRHEHQFKVEKEYTNTLKE